jgi:hypothetical protein
MRHFGSLCMTTPVFQKHIMPTAAAVLRHVYCSCAMPCLLLLCCFAMRLQGRQHITRASASSGPSQPQDAVTILQRSDGAGTAVVIGVSPGADADAVTQQVCCSCTIEATGHTPLLLLCCNCMWHTSNTPTAMHVQHTHTQPCHKCTCTCTAPTLLPHTTAAIAVQQQELLTLWQSHVACQHHLPQFPT